MALAAVAAKCARAPVQTPQPLHLQEEGLAGGHGSPEQDGAQHALPHRTRQRDQTGTAREHHPSARAQISLEIKMFFRITKDRLQTFVPSLKETAHAAILYVTLHTFREVDNCPWCSTSGRQRDLIIVVPGCKRGPWVRKQNTVCDGFVERTAICWRQAHFSDLLKTRAPRCNRDRFRPYLGPPRPVRSSAQRKTRATADSAHVLVRTPPQTARTMAGSGAAAAASADYDGAVRHHEYLSRSQQAAQKQMFTDQTHGHEELHLPAPVEGPCNEEDNVDLEKHEATDPPVELAPNNSQAHGVQHALDNDVQSMNFFAADNARSHAPHARGMTPHVLSTSHGISLTIATALTGIIAAVVGKAMLLAMKTICDARYAEVFASSTAPAA
eukprot:6187625-Pleurochrysis_carterae.AAC.2